MRHHICITTYDSPCGELVIGTFADRLCLCDWAGTPRHDRVMARLLRRLEADTRREMTDCTRAAMTQLGEYFSGTRTLFDMPLLPAGTPFQQKIWQSLHGIPYGRTHTYAAVAACVGMPRAARAVANAIASNPISIFIPCHRVIGADSSLRGYAGGTEAKRFLLAHESRKHITRVTS